MFVTFVIWIRKLNVVNVIIDKQNRYLMRINSAIFVKCIYNVLCVDESKAKWLVKLVAINIFLKAIVKDVVKK